MVELEAWSRTMTFNVSIELCNHCAKKFARFIEVE